MVANLSIVPETNKKMLDIVLVGMNHKTASVEQRECIAFSKEESINALDILYREPAINEVLLFSTCNRVEVLAVSENSDEAICCIKQFIADFKKIPQSKFESALYTYTMDNAVKHIFRVASSLDSMIVGEPQILGQIKQAFKVTASKKRSGPILNRLLHKAFCVAKRVRSETAICDNAVSISYAAIELGRKIFGSLEGKKVLLIGAGEMAELAVEHLIHHNAKQITVANRTFIRGVELAKKFNGNAIKFEEIIHELKNVDIIISSTGSPDYVVLRESVKPIMRARRNRPLFFIDIAVPRDIDPKINNLNNVYVYDIDDLKEVIDENIEERNREAIKGERIVDEAVIRFNEWFESLNVVPTIIDLKLKMQDIAKLELSKTKSSLKNLSDSDLQAISRMTESLINKILHDPIKFLKNSGHHGNESMYLSMTRTLFNLDK